jgi:hypothetical protein
LKKFIDQFNGVSTKHLNNYLVWNNWCNIVKSSFNDKADELLKVAVSILITIRYVDVPVRPVIPIP